VRKRGPGALVRYEGEVRRREGGQGDGVAMVKPAESWSLLVQDDSEEGFVDFKSAVVINETQFPEFIHEEVDS
jgi:hypothetical protein